MITKPATDMVASFTDETSARGSPYRVSINGQVDPQKPLDWFYDLITLFPDTQGELKSPRLLAAFEVFRKDDQERIWTGMRHVQIHVADPRPYAWERDEIWREAVGAPFPV